MTEAEEWPPGPKRRKVRKGTQSCWECKRRKIRCTFAATRETTCDGCRSRRVSCISQEFPNNAGVTRSRTARLDRVEALVEKLTKRTGDVSPSQPRARPVPAEAVFDPRPSDDRGICEALLEAWPSQAELDRMASADVEASVLFHGTVCLPYDRLLGQDLPSAHEMLRLPPPGSHPVLVARQLLLLGSFLQGIPGGPYRSIMSRAVETASRLITSQDSLVGDSLEGIECLMIESMYHNNAGHLRRAWQTHRRAIAVAQLMGLHLCGPSSEPHILSEEVKKRIDPDCMWFRLIVSDRYLSLMLGLPQAVQENRFAMAGALEACAPLERMERMAAVAGGLILQRNQEGMHDSRKTSEIDKLLQEAAAVMPPQWWLLPDIDGHASGQVPFDETIRIMNQLAYYHLLAQLHLPYLLQPADKRQCDESRLIAMQASRAILARFVSFRRVRAIAAFCRGVDFLALIGCTILCIAHIDTQQMGARAAVFCALSHQRLEDRGLMERTLQLLQDALARDPEDSLAATISSYLRRVLSIEAAASTGKWHYTATVSPDPKAEILNGGQAQAEDEPFCVSIPHFGSVKIERTNSLEYRNAAGVPNEGQDCSPFVDSDLQPVFDAAAFDTWSLQGVDTALFDNLMRGGDFNRDD